MTPSYNDTSLWTTEQLRTYNHLMAFNRHKLRCPQSCMLVVKDDSDDYESLRWSTDVITYRYKP